jgi:TetR/AcrR family transcriptional repressor of lmrAB and yxaGH operons
LSNQLNKLKGKSPRGGRLRTRMENPTSKTRIIRATLDLLGQSGLSGLTIKQIAAASATSKRSVEHLFPGGKLELANVAIEEAEQGIGQWFREVFHQRKSIAGKVGALFADAANNVEASGFTKGCPVAAVTLDIDRDSEKLRAVCHAVFTIWQEIIAAGLSEIPKARRREIAELILATLEGALILSRAEGTKDALLRAGSTLGDILTRRFKAKASRQRAGSGRRET